MKNKNIYFNQTQQIRFLAIFYLFNLFIYLFIYSFQKQQTEGHIIFQVFFLCNFLL